MRFLRLLHPARLMIWLLIWLNRIVLCSQTEAGSRYWDILCSLRGPDESNENKYYTMQCRGLFLGGRRVYYGASTSRKSSKLLFTDWVVPTYPNHFSGHIFMARRAFLWLYGLR